MPKHAEILAPIEPRKSVRVGEIALALAQRKPTEPTSSVSLTRNAKGDVQIAVDVTAHDVKVAGELAETEFDRLCAKYPREENGA